MNRHLDESERIKRVFRAREGIRRLDARYALSDPAFALMVQERERILTKYFQDLGKPLDACRVLDVGCGKGWSLLECWGVGAMGPLLYGIDLLPERLVEAKKLLPESHFSVSDARSLPFEDASFDVVVQFTVLSSILDAEVRRQVAREMLRVLNPERGVIISYDFWTNPVNRETAGISPDELRRLFPGCSFIFHKVSLAPPLARFLAPMSRSVCRMLASLKLLNTHYLTMIRRDKS